MTLLQGCILFFAAILGGTLNAVAGGGTFITLPSLIFTGVPPINANASSTVALWPGAIASIWAYRKELAKQRRSIILVLGGTSLIGGVLGAELLVNTSQSTFVKLLPYLLLVATVLFALSGPITTRLRKNAPTKKRQSWPVLVGIALLQLVIAIYGGYFGGGIGILMLTINGVAVVIFVMRGVVVWPQTMLMVVGAIIGGYGGAYFARKIDQRWVRGFVIAVGVSMTIYFFLRY